jgi:hypothetical protein
MEAGMMMSVRRLFEGTCSALVLLAWVLLVAPWNSAWAQENLDVEEAFEEAQGAFDDLTRAHPRYRVGATWMLLSTPHFSAHREAGQGNWLAFAEWWPRDEWGVRGLFAQQSFRRFGEPKTNAPLRHWGAMAKGRIPISGNLQAFAGAGFASTQLEDANAPKRATSLLSEFLLSFRMADQVWLEGGTFTFDGSSGEGPGDQRLGSTSYVVGITFGF